MRRVARGALFLLLGVSVGAEEFKIAYYPDEIALRVIARPNENTIVGLAELSLTDTTEMPYVMAGFSLESEEIRVAAGPMQQIGVAKLFTNPLSYSPSSDVLQSEGDVRLDSALGSHTLHGVVVTARTPLAPQIGVLVDSGGRVAPIGALLYQIDDDWLIEGRAMLVVPEVQDEDDWFFDYPLYPGRELFHSAFYIEYVTTPFKGHLALHLSYGVLVPIRPALTLLLHGGEGGVRGGVRVGAAAPDYFNHEGEVIKEWGIAGGWIDIDIGDYLVWSMSVDSTLYLPHRDGIPLEWYFSPLKVESSGGVEFSLPWADLVAASAELKPEGSGVAGVTVAHRYDSREDAEGLHRLLLTPLLRLIIPPLQVDASYTLTLWDDMYPEHALRLSGELDFGLFQTSLTVAGDITRDSSGAEKLDSELTARAAWLPPWGDWEVKWQMPLTELPDWDNSELTASFTFHP